jgi:ligand-binding sensor domain-containing protein
MKYFKLKNVIVIFCSFFLTTILPQNHISFNHLNVEDGLSQSVVTCILQDDNGFMWFGTQDGLNRYDGYSFNVFRSDPKDPESLKDNFIFSIYQSNGGPLYFETQQGNFHVYNPASESFSIVNKDSVNLFNTRYSSITALYLDPKGVIWSGGGSRRIGLTREDKNTGEITIFRHDPLDYNSLSSDRVYSIFRDRAGKLWIGTYSGLDILNEETGKFTHFNDITDDRNNLSTDWVWPIYQDSKGIMWFGTVNGGLNRFDPILKSIRYYKNIATDPSSLSHNYTFSIYEDRSGVIWIGTNAGGINYFSPSKLVFEHFINDPSNSNSLTNNEVLSAFVDRDGTYWIGTRNGGLNKLDFNRKVFKSITHNPQNNNSIISNSIQTLYQDSKGIIWIGTPGSGLDAYDPNKGKFTHLVLYGLGLTVEVSIGWIQ